jgi:hypothetical protein
LRHGLVIAAVSAAIMSVTAIMTVIDALASPLRGQPQVHDDTGAGA